MHTETLEIIQDKLYTELEKYADDNGAMSPACIDVLDKLTHAIKSVTTTLAMEGGTERGYRGETGGTYRRGRREYDHRRSDGTYDGPDEENLRRMIEKVMREAR